VLLEGSGVKCEIWSAAPTCTGLIEPLITSSHRDARARIDISQPTRSRMGTDDHATQSTLVAGMESKSKADCRLPTFGGLAIFSLR
jgi:hypothetical protein